MQHVHGSDATSVRISMLKSLGLYQDYQNANDICESITK